MLRAERVVMETKSHTLHPATARILGGSGGANNSDEAK